MYDPETAALIRATPPLTGLDRESLPDALTETFAQIAAARIRLRDSDAQQPEELASLLQDMRRLAYTNEALVSVVPERDDRRAAAFVAATAHQLCANADRLFAESIGPTFLGSSSISSDISSMLLFMVAEAMADAREIASALSWQASDAIEHALILALRDLARGELVVLISRSIPDREEVESDDPAITAVRALYREILGAVRMLANQILFGSDPDFQSDPISAFRLTCGLCIGPVQLVAESWTEAPTSSFAGPHHLASLLIAVSRDLPDVAVTRVPCPTGIDPSKWLGNTRRISKSRPFLWRNHLDAVNQGYLELGTSAAVGFPTGAGKSTLAELKISTALLTDRNVIFLAPTHALVDQTARSLAKSFPTASVQRERQDEFGFETGDDELPEILVMTPESCLAQMSIDSSILEDVGLFVFDECHLLHPGGNPGDRRAIDAMLCTLNLSKIAVDADFLLMSAMMKNTDDIAGWLSDLTGRTCLSLNLPWKPTRQLRGSVVYHQNVVTDLQNKLAVAKKKATTEAPPVAVKKRLVAEPLALFGMKQTWATNHRQDYSLVGLLDEEIQLAASKYWRLTPNAVAVSSSIAAASAEAGIKTLVFFQTIKNAASAAKQITKILPPVEIKLTDEEAGWLDSAISELGGPSHLYLDVVDGRVTQAAAVHHGLLLPQERYLCESLYNRTGGIKVLTATSTLAQGMNLPSELVIIGEDSRFDSATDRREILQAQELLNAAGRAGRAGDRSCGVVLVVPGKVVGIDLKNSTIGAHWTDLRAIFGQSDQCLEIDDPLTAVLDHVHAGTDATHEIERYAVVRLASGAAGETELASLSKSIRSSLAAYLAKKKDDDQWVEQRVESASAFFSSQSAVTEQELIESQVAGTLGLTLDLVSRLAEALETGRPDPEALVSDWRLWFFDWLSANPDLLEQVCRPQNLLELFGKKSYGAVEGVEQRTAFALPKLDEMTTRWMRGEPLTELQKVLGTDSKKLKTCDGARRFVLRVVPDLSYLFGLPALLHGRAQANAGSLEELSSAVTQLRRCVRLGLDRHEKAAMNQIMRSARFSRRQVHQHFASVEPHLDSAPAGETWEVTVARVEAALVGELNARDSYS